MRYFIEIAYKGTCYHGWQSQPNSKTIQGVLERNLSVLLKKEIIILGAGRTDTGVHATQFFAHFDVLEAIDKSIFIYKMNSLLPNDIVVFGLQSVKNVAHTRFDALSRSYEYRIHLGRDPFQQETTWQFFNKKLDILLMNQAANLLLETTNFKCFSKTRTDVKTFDCKVFNAVWEQQNKEVIFHITANRFLRNMVRAIVGTMIEVGTHKKSLQDFQQILNSKNRCLAGTSAPAKGLFLNKIIYPKDIFISDH